MTKTLNQIIYFPPPKSEYFFQQHWESEYFFRKKNHNPPPLEVKWSVPYQVRTQSKDWKANIFLLVLTDISIYY
jgi:hypothetical protein